MAIENCAVNIVGVDVLCQTLTVVVSSAVFAMSLMLFYHVGLVIAMLKKNCVGSIGRNEREAVKCSKGSTKLSDDHTSFSPARQHDVWKSWCIFSQVFTPVSKNSLIN